VSHDAVDWLNARGHKVGLLKVRLYRPFSVEDFVRALPATTRRIAVLDRTKEPGAVGEPLYLDVVSALREAREDGLTTLDPVVIGGRYGLSSKEYTPAMAAGVFDELSRPKPRRHFTVGIVDDVTHLSLDYDRELDIEPGDVVRAVFFGLGADGTVGANKNSIKIIGEGTGNYAQGYFVYDSKKSGAVTISHLRFGPRPLRSSYLIRQASFVGCHQFSFLDKFDVLDYAAPGAVFLLNSPYSKEEVWDHLPREVQRALIEKRIRFCVIDALAVAQKTGMKGRINTVMQTCFFAISGVLPRDRRSPPSRRASRRATGRRAPRWCKELRGHRPDARQSPRGAASKVTSRFSFPIVPDAAPDFVKRVTAVMLAKATCCRCRHFRWTGPSPPGRPAGRSATSPPRSRSGTRSSASSATSARWSAPTRRSGPSSTSPKRFRVRRSPSRRPTTAATTGRGRSTRSRSRPRTAPDARSA
jgi:pyruvate-ferredoxin/flavodoxin oxidoreductase